MKFLQFGIKYADSKNGFVRILAVIALKIVATVTGSMEKQIKKKQIDIPADNNRLDKIFKQIKELENEGRPV